MSDLVERYRDGIEVGRRQMMGEIERLRAELEEATRLLDHWRDESKRRATKCDELLAALEQSVKLASTAVIENASIVMERLTTIAPKLEKRDE